MGDRASFYLLAINDKVLRSQSYLSCKPTLQIPGFSEKSGISPSRILEECDRVQPFGHENSEALA
ncbi:hypothetical protein [Coleofasciculus sp. FACHB-1120]|uniref:hypothetical protein n=1 Tax=Coleofasciculus sp. FACHB-1120 TaxID=2692783 RepID=UPI0016830922|nr:hypothetical protein [Coleofasciculus sp. FACHB-1120]MBD2743177.1 hypothetical protein [Coleofasciculus sp. FACHB-1120]